MSAATATTKEFAMSDLGLTSGTTFVNASIDYWCRRGCSRDLFVDALGEHADHISDINYRIPAATVSQLYDLAAESLNDKTLGLKTGCHFPPTAFGVIGHVILASNTVGQILEAICRYCFLMSDFIEVNLVKTKETGKIVYTPCIDISHHLMDSCIACFVANSKMMVRDFSVDVALRHPPYASFEDYQSVLQVDTIQFDQGEYSASFPIAALEHVIGFGNRENYLEQTKRANAELRELNIPAAWTKQVRAVLTPLFYQGEPEISDAAKALGVSVRVLQRHLQSESTSFRQLVDDTRKEVVLKHLSDNQLPIHEIAFLAGYKENSSFYKAFRRWTGTTPKRFQSPHP